VASYRKVDAHVEDTLAGAAVGGGAEGERRGEGGVVGRLNQLQLHARIGYCHSAGIARAATLGDYAAAHRLDPDTACASTAEQSTKDSPSYLLLGNLNTIPTFHSICCCRSSACKDESADW
jgi:hypothetical protein